MGSLIASIMDGTLRKKRRNLKIQAAKEAENVMNMDQYDEVCIGYRGGKAGRILLASGAEIYRVRGNHKKLISRYYPEWT